MITYCFVNDPDPGLIARITSLYRQAGWWGEGPDQPEHLATLVAGSHCFLLALDGEEPVGMGRAISDRVSDAYIQDLTVRAEWRGQGIASELVRRLVQRLEQDGLRWIGLVAEQGSQPLYDRLGFQPMAEAVPMLRRS